MSLVHPFAMRRARAEAAFELQQRGERARTANHMVASLDDDDIQAAAANDPEYVAAMAAVGDKVGAFGDGSIIAAIVAFFKSAQGQAIIAALVKLILGLLVI